MDVRKILVKERDYWMELALEMELDNKLLERELNSIKEILDKRGIEYDR